MAKVNYLNNKDMLAEIHKSKATYCSYLTPEDQAYDLILPSVDKINRLSIAEGKRERAKRLTKLTGEVVDPKDITNQDLVFRIMTFDHIPNSDRKNKPKTVADSKAKVHFPPFHHWRFTDKKELICVGKSHWKEGLSNGSFNTTHGKFTNKLAKMFLLLTARYGTRGNWRGYTYNDEMQGQALMQLSQIGLQFDESKSDNPFAYYTAAITNSFTRILNVEKKNQSLRDDILQENGMTPSHTRQMEWEIKQKAERDLREKESKF